MTDVHLWSWLGHHRLGSVLVLGTVLVLAAGGAVWLVFVRSTSSPVTLGDALRLYRSERTNGPVRPGPARALSPGVYSYRTSGGESLSLPGTARPFPARTEMVTADGPAGCSSVDWVPIVQHSEKTSVCSGPGGSLIATGFTTEVQIGGTSSTSVISCPATTYLVPPAPTDGRHWSSVCHQKSPAMAVRADGLVQGRESVDVGGRSVPSVRVRLVLRFDIGVSTTDLWVSPSRGLVVREDEVADFSDLGVRYSERMSAVLESLTPST